MYHPPGNESLFGGNGGRCQKCWGVLQQTGSVSATQSFKKDYDTTCHKRAYRIPMAMLSPHVRESMTVVNSGFHPVDSGFRALDSGFQLSGFRIPKRAGFQIFFCFNAFLRTSFSCSNLAIPVSYTHLTLPTKRIV